MVLRFWFLVVAIFLAYSFLLFHLYELQITHGDYYLAKAESEYLASSVTNASRGAIYFSDKNGNQLPAAINKDFPLIYAVPKAISDPVAAAAAVAPILGETKKSLEAIFSKNNDPYEPLVHRASSDMANKINDLEIKGIYADMEPGRYYPLGTAASQVLGFVGPSSNKLENSGHYGLEEFYDGILSGKAGSFSGNKVIQPKAGEDLTVTIDLNIQIEAEKILNDLVKNYNATGGSIVVADPVTGKILAMSSYPNFDPNNYSSFPLSNFMNPVVQKIYEPGSIFKIITMSAGIDAGKITTSTTYYDTGSVTLNGKTIRNYDLKAYGLATMTNVIEHSINTGAVFAERRIGRDIFLKYIKDFGFGEKTGIDLPGEVAGNLGNLNPKAPDINFATASYGQGVAVSPIEIVSAVSAIANGGLLMRPYLNASLKPAVIRRVISPETAKAVTEMMISAVDKAGVAEIKGYSIAGKTGTAFIPNFQSGGYTDKVIDSYVGFGPASNPKFIILIKLDGLDSSQLAALSVVPAFRELAQYILNYYNIPPDRL
jgi:cell division protein FtsI/penicillin-binding protein 2